MVRKKTVASTQYVTQSDFSESQVEKDVSNYLGYVSRLANPRFRLDQSDEPVSGADAEFHWAGRVLFLQFKRPTGLASVANVPLPKVRRKNESKMQDVRRFRNEQRLLDHPHSLCFPLRKQAKHATELQHNLLNALEIPPHSRALYVCPTFVTKIEYERAMNVDDALRFLERPFLLGDFPQWQHQLVWILHTAPLLRAHVTIVPHKRVASSDHYYSFSAYGSEVAFHSPEVVENEVLRLSDVVGDEIRSLFEGRDASVPLEKLAAMLFERSRGWAGPQLDGPRHGSSAEWLRSHGKVLQKEYGIRQLLLLKRGEKRERPSPG